MRTLLVLFLAFGAGCATYEPQPLDPEAERAALARRSVDGLVVQRTRPGAEPSPAAVPFDPADGLDERELVAVGLTLNPGLQAKRLEIGEADALLISAGRWPNPVLGVGWRGGIQGAPGYTLDADLLVDLLKIWERSARQGAAGARIKEASAEILAEEWKVVAELRKARLRVLALEQSVGVLREELALRGGIRDLVKQRRAAGDGTELDVSTAELDLADLARDLRREQGGLQSARRDLNRVLGLPPGYPLPLSDSGKPLTIAVYDDLDAVELERRFMAGRFELKAKEAAYERSEKELELALYGQYPRIGIGPSFGREPEHTSYLGFSLSFEIPLFDRNQGEIAAKEAERRRQRAEYVALLHRIQSEATEALAQARRSRTEVEIEEKETLPLVRRGGELTAGAFQARELNVFDWVAAQRRSLQARKNYVDALVAHRAAVIELESATGVSLSVPVEKKKD